MNLGIETTDTAEFKIERPSIQTVLGGINSCLGLDIAKLHSGIAIWNNGKLNQYGFALKEYDKDNPHAEFEMRLNLKEQLSKLIGGMSFDYCIIEDVYGGENFDTVRKLVTLNTVIDELIYEGVVTVRNFFRWKEARWLKYFREIYKIKGRPNSKYETQEILKYISEPFYMANHDKSNAEKKKIFFEDICDATAMVCSVAMYVRLSDLDTKTSVNMSDLRFYYVNAYDDFLLINDWRLQDYEPKLLDVKLNYNLDSLLLDLISNYPDDVLCIHLPVSRLGSFGIKHKFEFYDDGDGYLFFYRKW